MRGDVVGGPSGWTTRASAVPEEAAAALSVEEFRERYESVNLPVVIRGAANAWPAMTTWTRERLGRDFGETDLGVRRI